MCNKLFIIIHFLFILPFMGGCMSVFAQSERKVSGLVTDAETGETLIGVLVQQKGEETMATTDVNGRYEIIIHHDDSSQPPTLVFSYIGMEKKEVQVGNRDVLNVRMESGVSQLDEVVVVAYGTRKKGTITGSVATVKGESINDTPVASFDQALQGKAAGLTVLQDSGDPTAPASFQIRGTNSINAGTEPLFVVDGVPVSSSEFSTINPSDIESFSVLKDASSTSIYGARAANGVVVITTKRGRSGDKAQVMLRAQYGFSNLAYGHWTQMNTSQRLDFEEEIGIRTPGLYDRETLERTNINWRDLVFRNNAPTQSYDLSVAGGGSRISYFVSANVFDQTGTAIGSDFSRYTLRANVEAQANDWLRIGTNTSLSSSKAHEADYGSYSIVSPISAMKFMLPYWDPYKADGTYASPADGTWRGSYENPLEWNEANPLTRKRVHVLSSTFLELEPMKDLRIKTLLGIDGGDLRSDTKSMPSYVGNYGIGTVGKSFMRSYNITWTNTATYTTGFSNSDDSETSVHQLTLLLGHEMTRNASDAFTVVARGQSSDKLMTLATGTAATNWSDSRAASTYLSYFGRAEYNYRQSLYADLSIRRDASSKFGKDSRWATFWSAGMMCDLLNAIPQLKNEQGKSFLSMLQLSASYGTSGNSSIPNYDHLSLYSAGPQYSGMPGVAPYSRGNESLTWEKLNTLNVGLRVGLWNRLTMGVEFYNKRTTDMLMEVPITMGNGFSSQWDNIGAMLNRGVELDVQATIFRNKAFNWSINANASYNHNEITELYNGLDEYELPATGLMLKVGHPYGEQYAVCYAGVNPANGDALWYNKDGDITNVYSEEDKVLTGKSYVAPWQGGFGTTLSWKGLTLDAQFSWVANRWVMNNDRFFDESNGLYSSAYNQSTELFNRWKEPGDVTTLPRYGVTPEMDTHLIEDASFLRLKNVMLSYTVPRRLLRPTKVIERIRVFAQAQNLLTFTKFTGMDPESSVNVYQATYPMSRQFTMGIEVGF